MNSQPLLSREEVELYLAFREDQHPRGQGGKFAKKGSKTWGNEPTPEPTKRMYPPDYKPSLAEIESYRGGKKPWKDPKNIDEGSVGDDSSAMLDSIKTNLSKAKGIHRVTVSNGVVKGFDDTGKQIFKATINSSDGVYIRNDVRFDSVEDMIDDWVKHGRKGENIKMSLPVLSRKEVLTHMSRGMRMSQPDGPILQEGEAEALLLAFEESKHPRGKGGKFAKKAEGGSNLGPDGMFPSKYAPEQQRMIDEGLKNDDLLNKADYKSYIDEGLPAKLRSTPDRVVQVKSNAIDVAEHLEVWHYNGRTYVQPGPNVGGMEYEPFSIEGLWAPKALTKWYVEAFAGLTHDS